MKFLASFSTLIPRYDAFILDLWGVIHDGQQLYPGVKECLEELRAQDKKIVFLSNAPRRAATVQEALTRMGIGESLYDRIITSGETAYQSMAVLAPSRGKEFQSYFYIGLEKDRRILSGLDYAEVAEPESAQFLLLAHSYTDNQPWAELEPLLKRCRARDLPAICINPDLEVVRMNGEHVYCAGWLAKDYERMGGDMAYFGKPHPAVYDLCLKTFADLPQDRILAVGDNLATDIQGARRMGIANALVTGGVLKSAVGDRDDYEERCRRITGGEGIAPDYVLRVFNV